MGETADVLVVGAGPVGLTVAAALARLGVGVRVIDQASGTKRQARAAVVWPRAAEVLDDIGAAASVVQAANPLRSVEVVASGRRVGLLRLGYLDSAYPCPLVIEQHDIERLLVDAFGELGGTVHWEQELVDLRVRDAGVDAVVRGADGADHVVEAAWVVGCDGTRSRVRQAAGIAFAGRPRRNLQVLQINAHPRWDLRADRDHGWFFLEPNASLGVFAVPGGGYRFFCFTTDPDPSQTAPPTVEQMRRLVALITRHPDLALTPTEPYWANRARFQDRIAARLRRGRILLAGDAAHAWAPIGGHGMNAGLRGAHNLAWKLAAVVAGHADAGILDTYDTEQRAAARTVMAEMRFNPLELPLPPAAYWPATAGMRVALAVPAAQRRIEHALSDLGMRHRRSALSVEASRAPGARAGSRVPNASVTVGGRKTQLHEVLGYDRWTLLAGPATDPAALARAIEHRPGIRLVRLDTDPDGAPALSAPLLLIRPDRHIGLRADATDVAALDAYCGQHWR